MGILRVTIADTTMVQAYRGRLHLSVQGKSVPWQKVVEHRSPEVQGLIAALKEIGLTEDRFTFDSITLAAVPGALRGSDSVNFRLTVTVTAAQATGALGVVADQPNVELLNLEWLYDDYEAGIPVLATAMVKARRKADILANAAGVRLVGIARITDAWSAPPPSTGPKTIPWVDLAATHELALRLTVDFEILRLGESAARPPAYLHLAQADAAQSEWPVTAASPEAPKRAA